MLKRVSTDGWQKFGRRTLTGLVTVASVAISYTIVGAWRQAPSTDAEPALKANVDPPVNPFASANGRHLIAYIITSSDCMQSAASGGSCARRTENLTRK